MRPVHLAIGLLAFSLAGLATAESDLNNLRGKSRGVNDARDTGAAALDPSIFGDAGQVEGYRGSGSSSIDRLHETNRGWQPPECAPRPPADLKLPQVDDVAAWELALGRAEDRHAATKASWEQLESGAVVSRSDGRDRAAQKVTNERALEKARDGYSKARCDLKALLGGARPGGMHLSALQPYVDRAPTDLRPW